MAEKIPPKKETRAKSQNNIEELDSAKYPSNNERLQWCHKIRQLMVLLLLEDEAELNIIKNNFFSNDPNLGDNEYTRVYLCEGSDLLHEQLIESCVGQDLFRNIFLACVVFIEKWLIGQEAPFKRDDLRQWSIEYGIALAINQKQPSITDFSDELLRCYIQTCEERFHAEITTALSDMISAENPSTVFQNSIQPYIANAVLGADIRPRLKSELTARLIKLLKTSDKNIAQQAGFNFRFYTELAQGFSKVQRLTEACYEF